MKHFFEIKDEFNLLIDDCLAVSQLEKEYASLPSGEEKRRLSLKLQEKSTLIRNHIVNMIGLCNESSIWLDGFLVAALPRIQLMLDKFVPLLKTGEFNKRTATKFEKKSLRPIADTLFVERSNLLCGRLEDFEKSKLSALSFKLGVINLVVNLCHDIARLFRKLLGKQSFADKFEAAIDKAAQEIKRELQTEQKLKKSRELDGAQKGSLSSPATSVSLPAVVVVRKPELPAEEKEMLRKAAKNAQRHHMREAKGARPGLPVIAAPLIGVKQNQGVMSYADAVRKNLTGPTQGIVTDQPKKPRIMIRVRTNQR